MRITRTSTICNVPLLLILLSCASNDADEPHGAPGPSGTVGTTYDNRITPIDATESVPLALQEALTAAAELDGASLQSTYAVPPSAGLGYDPLSAAGLDLIAASALSLNEAETARLAQNGFVISTRQVFPSFSYGYKSIYADDLPVFVSADSLLDALHRSFDELLKATEQQVLIGELDTLLGNMRAHLAATAWDERTRKDVDLYLTVASSLLRGAALPPAAGASQEKLQDLVNKALNADGHELVELFGTKRDEDFSQFEPRGHYTDSEELGRYFKAMMWLGRVDLRLVETLGSGEQVFRRPMFDAAVALRELMNAEDYARWTQIDSVIGAFVGEHDSMSPQSLDGLLQALGVSSLAGAAALSDEQIVAELVAGNWGAQRIASRIIYKAPGAGGTLPLDRSFLLFGQRYTVDSHVFSNVVFDRVATRMMPEPLDVAFAALGNNAALPLLADEFNDASYVDQLASTRVLVDAHEAEYWQSSVYTTWMDSLRALSPSARDAATLPSVANTTAWHKRVLSSQLASWAELRHDTILYVKQSYTTGVLCEFPDAYVDPYPEAYAKLAATADLVASVIETLPDSAGDLKTSAGAWADNFASVALKLQEMAENQRTGAPHSQELLDFINDAVKWDEEFAGCGGDIYRTNLAGWYLKLFFMPQQGFEYDPTIADVHTQPTDEAGNDVGRILHVGTRMPRLMVVTANTCEGPKAYAGLAFSYAEVVTEDWERLTDEEWKEQAEDAEDVPWLSDVLAP